MKKILLLSLLSLTACAGLDVQQTGDVPKAVQIEKIQQKKGVSKAYVKDALGPAHFESNTPSVLVYGQTVKEMRGFLAPKDLERDIYVFAFDRQDRLQSVRHLTLQDGFDVAYVSKETPTRKSSPDLMKQLLENFGKYNVGNTGDMQKR